MYRAFFGAALLTLGFGIVTTKAADEKKEPATKADKKENAGKKENAKENAGKKENAYVAAGKLAGTIVSVEESTRTLRINTGQKAINPVAREALQQAVKAHKKARTPQEKAAAVEQA